MKTLVIVAHPNETESRANRRWAEAIGKQEGVTVHRLYESYPEWRIQVEREQELLLAHDRIILQFPFYWYSSPPLLKKWLDEVLTFNWAYGPEGTKLHGKELMLAVSTGGPQFAYQPGGYNNYTVAELLRPFQATSNLIGTVFLPIYQSNGIYQQSDAALDKSAEEYVAHALKTDYHSPRLVKE
jgi:glutathione-regulated potassium-efflux system ancillary protein KefG